MKKKKNVKKNRPDYPTDALNLQRLPKSFSPLHVKNATFFLSYFLKNDD